MSPTTLIKVRIYGSDPRWDDEEVFHVESIGAARDVIEESLNQYINGVDPTHMGDEIAHRERAVVQLNHSNTALRIRGALERGETWTLKVGDPSYNPTVYEVSGEEAPNAQVTR